MLGRCVLPQTQLIKLKIVLGGLDRVGKRAIRRLSSLQLGGNDIRSADGKDSSAGVIGSPWDTKYFGVPEV